MSRTKRKHWLREEMRDGIKRTHVKSKKSLEYVYDEDSGELGEDVTVKCYSCGCKLEQREWYHPEALCRGCS